jgi:propanediol utilization protein pduL
LGDIMDKNELERIIRDKLQEILTTEKEDTFMVEASGRHVHLTKEHVEALFGEGYELTPVKDLSQPGQFAAKERVRVIGPKGEFSSVAILGPCRNFSQVELSLTDCREIGVKGVIRESGKIEGTPGILIGVGDKYIQLDKGLIVARRHIHMTSEDAKRLSVNDGETVKVKIHSDRPLIFDDVLIRVKDSFRLSMHIDFDEANACGYTSGVTGSIVKD